MDNSCKWCHVECICKASSTLATITGDYIIADFIVAETATVVADFADNYCIAYIV